MKSSTVIGAWEKTVRAGAAEPAVIEAASGRVTTRGELDALADAWSREHGEKLNQRAVLFAEPNGCEWFRVFLGLLKSGAVVGALDGGEPVQAQEAAAAATGASFVWRDGRLRALAGRRFRDGRRILKLTSGSSGAPKVLAFTDAQMMADGRQVCAGMEIGAQDVNYALIPFGHSYGLGNLVMPLLAQGTAVVVGSAPLPHVIAAEISRWNATVFPAVPALLAALANSGVRREELRSLRRIISAGAPLAPEIAQAFSARFALKIHSFYGSSETGGISFDRSGDAAMTGQSVGTPLPGVRLRFGRGARFTVESAAVVTLGNRRPKSRRGSGVFRPADFGEINPDGELVLRGRARSFVKIAGRRLNLAEVERALRALAGVRDAFVLQAVARPDQLLAAVESERAPDELRAELRDRLAAWKLPRRIVAFAAFPLTKRGKPDTRRLTEWLRAPAGKLSR